MINTGEEKSLEKKAGSLWVLKWQGGLNIDMEMQETDKEDPAWKQQHAALIEKQGSGIHSHAGQQRVTDALAFLLQPPYTAPVLSWSLQCCRWGPT